MIGRPFPIGALIKSNRSAFLYVLYKLAAFAVSIADPPPTARKCVMFEARVHSIASCM